MVNVFDFDDYKAFLKSVEEQRSSIQRGFRSRLAEVLSCQNAYVSQILNSGANFSLEQGLKLADFLQLNEEESRYFLQLIEYARAGTAELKRYFKREFGALKQKHLNLKDRVPKEKELTPESQSLYYSNFIYPIVHMMVTIPEYRSVSIIAAALRVSEKEIQDAVLFLISTDLIIEKGGELRPGPTLLHLGKDSPHIRQHHTNWRISAIQSLGRLHDDGIHYSTVSSLSKQDAEKLKTKFVTLIKEYVETVGPSREETVYNFNLDFYSLISP